MGRGPPEPDGAKGDVHAATGDHERQVGADELGAGCGERHAVEGRRPRCRRFGEWMGRVLRLGLEARWVGHADRGGQGQTRSVGILEEDRADLGTQAGGAGVEDRLQRRVELGPGRGCGDGAGQAGSGIAGRTVAGHGSTPARTMISERASYTRRFERNMR